MKAHLLRKKYYEAVQTLKAYQSAVNEAAVVSITDLNGRILYVNDKFTEISKYTPEELIGKTHHIINSGFHPAEFFRNMWQTIGQGKHWRGEIKNKTKDGEYYWVDTVITPVIDQQGRIFQYLSIRNLITAKKENEEKLIKAQAEIIRREQQLKDAQQVAKTGSWHFNLPDNRLDWSEETYNIFEDPVNTNITYESFLEKVHPDDRDMVNKSWMAALKNGEYEVEHRIKTRSGVKWVSERAHFEFEKKNVLKTALGTVQDITEKKKIEADLIESENLYKTLFNNSPFAVGIVEKDSLQFLEVNDTALQLYDYSREEFLKLTIYDIRLEKEHDKVQNQVSAGKYVTDKTIRTHRKRNGELIQVEPTISEITYKGRQVYLITITDNTEKIRIHEELNQAKISKQKEIMEAQEESRSEIARELHDNINQLLAAAILHFNILKPLTEKDQQIKNTSIEIIGSAIDEIRKLSAALVTPTLNNISLKESIEYLSKSLEISGVIPVIRIRIRENMMQEGFKVNIYRIVQEQLNNIMKYSEATKVQIELLQKGNLVTLQVTDNGKGFDKKEKSSGIGFKNISYRTELYNGRMSVESVIGAGCTLSVELPLAPV